MIIIRYNPIREESDGNVQDGRLLQRCEGPFLYPALRYPYYKNTKEPSFLHLNYIYK